MNQVPTQRVAVILPHHIYVVLVRAVVGRGDSLSGFIRQAVLKEMHIMGMLPPERKARPGVVSATTLNEVQ